MELKGRAFNFGYGFGEPLECFNIPIPRQRVEAHQFREDSASKSSSGFAKFGNSGSFINSGDSQPVVNLGFQEVAQNSTYGTAEKNSATFSDKFEKFLKSHGYSFLLLVSWAAGCVMTDLYCLF